MQTTFRFKPLVTLILLIMFSLPGRSQDNIIRKIFPDSVSDCRDLQYQSMQLIPLYYDDRSFDTAYALLEFWQAHCPFDETMFRSRVLFAIDEGTFSDSLFKDVDFTYYLDVYKELASDTTGSSLKYYPDYYVEEFELLKWYKNFTDSIAYRCIRYTDLSPEEYFFANYYLHPADSMYMMLHDKEFNNTTLKKITTSPRYGPFPDIQGHYSFGAGMWMPDQNLDTLGMHPYLSGQLGLRYKRYKADLTLELRVGESPNKYQVVVDGTPTDTRQFLGISLRTDFGYDLLQLRGTDLIFVGGIGYENIQVYYETNDPDDENDDVSKHLHSFNLNLGGSYRIYIKNNRYIGLTGRYHIINFRNKGGTDLKGNALTLGLEYGFGTSRWLHNRDTVLREKTGKN